MLNASEAVDVRAAPISGAAHAMARSLVVALILAAFVVAMLWIGGAHPGAQEPLAVTAGAAVVVLAGELLLEFTGLDTIPARIPVAVVLGAGATSLVLLAGVLIIGHTASVVFVGWAIAVVLARLTFGTARKAVAPSDFVDILAIACLAVVVGFWCRNCAAAIPHLKETGVLPLWSDYAIHGTIIAHFGDALAAGRGSLEFADQPVAFYHYASYMLAAAVQGIVDLPGLGLAGCVMLPVGLLIGAVGSYSLATALADRRAGVIAIGLLTLLPDPSRYGLANGFLGFHWGLFSQPGAGYALGTVGISLVFVIEWLHTRRPAALIFSLATAAAVFEQRAHIFAWFAPALAATLLLTTGFAQRRLRWAWWTALACAVAALLLAAIPSLRAFWLEWSAVDRFLAFVHQDQEPTAYTGLYPYLVGNLGLGAAVLIGTALLLPGVLGIFVVVYPLALAASIRRAGWQATDLFPPVLLLVFLAFVLFVSWTPTEITELKHRAVVLPYQIIAIWTAAYLCQITAGRTTGKSAPVALSVWGVAALSIVSGLLIGVEPAQPKFAWGKRFFRVALTPGLVDAAGYLRGSIQPGDTFALSPADPNAFSEDIATFVVGLTNMPCYLARAGIQSRGPARRTALERLARLLEIEDTADQNQAMALLQKRRVDWYVVIGAAGPRFDPTHAHAAFTAGHAAVYRVRADDLPRAAQHSGSM